MRRWHSETAIMLRRRGFDARWPAGEAPLGRLRKKHPLDCGCTACATCHFSKWDRRRRTERDRAIRFELDVA